MPKFSYSAKNMAGDVIRGVYTASERTAVVSMIRTKSYFPLDIKEMMEKEEKRDIDFAPRIPEKDIAIFCTQFASVLKAGVPISQAFEIMKSQSANKKLSKVIMDVREKIQQGQSLSTAFNAHAERFPHLFLSMVEAGEMSGTLESSFERMGTSFTNNYKLNQKVKSAMIYPIILSIVALCVVIFLLVAIVPTFTGLYASSGTQLPLPTRILLSLSSFMVHNIILIAMCTAFFAITINIYIQTEVGKLLKDKIKVTMPVVGKLLNVVYAARFTRSVSTLSATGVALPQALEVTSANLDNTYVAKLLKTVIEDVNKGRGLSTPLAEMNFFPPMVLHMCRLGEESGTIDSLLAQAADYYEAESETAMTRLASLVEPMVIVMMGGAVLFIVLSILLPMFGMYSMVA